MDQLTQEQGVRCSVACGVSKKLWNKLILSNNLQDPFFWFPRLVEKLRAEFARTGITPEALHEAVGVPSIWLDYMDGTIDLPECLERLCAAIEALKEKK
jgi:hypothetical protein